MTDISKVIEALNELSHWLEHTNCSEHIREIIRRLEAPDTSAMELRQLKKSVQQKICFTRNVSATFMFPVLRETARSLRG